MRGAGPFFINFPYSYGILESILTMKVYSDKTASPNHVTAVISLPVVEGVHYVADSSQKIIAKYQSSGPIGSGRLVAMRLFAQDQVEYASSDNPNHAFLVRGLTLNSVPGAGNEVQIQTTGDITDSTWNWIPGKPIFLGTNGNISQIYDSSKSFSLIIGVAITPTTILLKVQNPIFLI
ncbi:MAG: hypothetical protein JWO15_3699 [Sphingomonadales bacterium]|nr:hypothetical protein [Sphingomonadales bacterium]